MNTLLNRRAALVSAVAATVAGTAPAVASASPQAGPNDRKLMALEVQIQDLDRQRADIQAQTEAIFNDALPDHLRHDALRAYLDHMAAEARSGASAEQLDAMRDELRARQNENRRILANTELDSLDDQSERLGKQRREMQDAMAEVMPDTMAGVAVLARHIKHECGRTGNDISEQLYGGPEEKIADNVLSFVIANA